MSYYLIRNANPDDQSMAIAASRLIYGKSLNEYLIEAIKKLASEGRRKHLHPRTANKHNRLTVDEELLLTLIKRLGPSTISEIARNFKRTRPEIEPLILDLFEAGFLIEKRNRPGQKNIRKWVFYDINRSKMT